MSHTCLNCSTPAILNFCPNCGQKTSTHRYSIKHFVAHDFVHGVWHVEKGMFFTIKELFTRPGHSVREYIEGKRVNHYSFVNLILMIVALSALLLPYSHISMADLTSNEAREMTGSLEKFMAEHPKLVVIITVPLYSVFSFAWFRRARLNFSEHLVLNSYRIIPELIVGLLLTALTAIYTDTKVLTQAYFVVSLVFSLVYPTWFYHQFFSTYKYTKKGLFIKSLMVPISYFLLYILIGVVAQMVKMLAH
jgi:hypothetical protein